MIDQYQADIKRFGKVLKVIKTFEPVFAIMSVSAMLRLFRFSTGFGDTIVFPLVALFMGTGNQTPHVSAAIIERLFLDPSMALFEFDPDSFLAEIPEMRAFPQLSGVYDSWKAEVESRGTVKVRLRTEVVGVDRSYKWRDEKTGKRRSGVKLVSREVAGVGLDQLTKEDPEAKPKEEVFDEIIIACDADSALKVLGKDATWMERKVLGNVLYLWDITTTHSDFDYMQKVRSPAFTAWDLSLKGCWQFYRVQYSDDLASSKRREAGDPKAKESFEFAEKNFTPLYCASVLKPGSAEEADRSSSVIRTYPDDPKKIEMSFDLTHVRLRLLFAPPQP